MRAPLPWTYDDGGRGDAGFRGEAGDCATRAAAIVTGLPYRDAYDRINALAQENERPRKRKRSSAREGVWPETLRLFMEERGFVWTPTMTIGSGCKVHLAEGELPGGALVVRCSRHYTAILDGIVHDTHDPTREGTRCVYGYWKGGDR